MPSFIMPQKLTRTLFVWHMLPAMVVAGVALFLLSLKPNLDRTLQILLGIILSAAALIVASYLLRKDRLASLGSVEEQLTSLKASGVSSSKTLPVPKTLLGSNTIIHGWNLLADRLRERRWNEAIENSLSSITEGSSHDLVYRMARCHSDGIAITDRQGMIRFSNPAWSNMVDLGEGANTTGEQIFNHLKLKERKGGADLENRLRYSSSPITQLVHLGNSLNDGVWRLSRIPLDGRARDPEAFVWILRDHTQQSIAEDARDRFVGAATHELRTPLANILAYSETLAQSNLDVDQQREFYNVISSEAQRLGRLLDQLLNLQQMEAGSLTLDRASCDLLRLTEEAYEHMKPSAELRGLQLELKMPPSLPPLKLDKEKIISLLINLLGNAIKYTLPGGSVRLVVSSQSDEIRVSVEDTGIGISTEDQEKVFERFYRCQDSRTSDQVGNGLGLALAREVALLHDGDLTLTSELDKGSCFTLHLPLENKR
jgi:two-component system phosphate regulon sensor histidine kinase PhoR